jgi:hypothetical protein
MKVCPKDQWIIDYIENFVTDEDLKVSAIKRLATVKDSVMRLAELGKMSVGDKNRIIRHSESCLQPAI